MVSVIFNFMADFENGVYFITVIMLRGANILPDRHTDIFSTLFFFMAESMFSSPVDIAVVGPVNEIYILLHSNYFCQYHLKQSEMIKIQNRENANSRYSNITENFS